MKEVSTRALGNFFRPLEKKGVSLEEIVVDTKVAVSTLRSKKERIDWSEFVAIMANLRRHFSDEEYVEIGRSYFRAPTLRFAFVVARMLFSPMDFYRWINKPRNGIGNQMFTCIVPSHRELSDCEIEVELTLAPGYPVCRDFFTVTIGNFEEMPRLLGCPAATVSLTHLPNGARFHILVPQRTPLLTRLRRVVTWPFVARSAARELKDAHETLLERYEQLQQAQTTLDLQAAQLRVAHSVNSLVQRDLDLQTTMEVATNALVSHAGFVGAEVHVEGGIAGDTAFKAHFGERAGTALAHQLLGQGGQRFGELTVSVTETADRTERQALLAFVVPMLSMALQNAISYRNLEQYRLNLERLVDERTSDLRAARDDLSATVVQLREVQGTRDVFFSNINHEIRTPLSLIILAAGDIEMHAGPSLDDRARSNLESVVGGARKLLRLVDELLLLAAGDEAKLQFKREPRDIGRLVSSLIEIWRPAAVAAGLAMRRIGVVSAIALVDETAFDRIVTNLVSNAVKFTPSGGEITVELVERGDRVAILVQDTGLGIDDELAARLFGRFERSHQSGKSGSGIGLSLVKQLVEAHGGVVTVARRPQGGSEFCVELPRHLATEPVLATSSLEVRRRLGPADFGVASSALVSGQVSRPPSTSLGTVLVAEDDPDLSAAVVRLLADEYVVISAFDGTSALELAKLHQPHLLVTDVQMPGMDGIELAERFRSAANDRLAPVIIMSAIGDLGTRVKGLEAGAIDYVVKPFDPRELRARVKAQFRMRDLALRLHHAEQLSALGTLSAGLAHELRNPANGIINAIRPLTKLLPPELSAKQSPVGQLLEVARGCADQIAFLSRQLLNFRSNGELELRQISMADLVKRSLILTQEALSGVDVRVALGFEGVVHCAPHLMMQVLTNLVDNAAQAAKSGGWIELAAHADGSTISIEVSDSGGGVPPELRERIFEPFFTTKPPGVGTGLGLPLARDIVHRHGGTLEIRDRGSQCVFAVDLPRREPTTAANVV